MFYGILFFLESQPPTQNSPFSHFLVLLFLWLFIIWFIAIRPQKKADNQRLQKLSQLKKNDRVVTIGGIIGVVDHLSDQEIVLKVDEKNNTKIRFLRTSISRLLEEEKNEDKKDEKTATNE